MAATAFSSIPADLPRSHRGNGRAISNDNQKQSSDVFQKGPQPQESELTTPSTESYPWRVVLDIGREPLARMPFDWARSGCRMPLAIPCDFSQKVSSTGGDNNEFLVLPKSDTVTFTGPDGAVVKPVVGGTWQTSEDQKQISLSFTFPETLQRRDVTIDAGTKVELTGRMYTQEELNQLNQAYYEARESTWQLGGDLNDIARQQGAAKKWNEEKGVWEKPKSDANPFSMMQNRIKYMASKAQQDKRNQERPDANSISNRGKLPGLGDDNGVYILKGGVVRQGKSGPVMGTWQAEPITKNPVSYRN